VPTNPSPGQPRAGGENSGSSRYAGTKAGLATRHGKLPLIAPALAPLGLDVVLVPEVDTDAFGTFTGEVARTGTAAETVLAKATAAAQESGLGLGLASEGSFGPHPAIPFLTLDIELVAFLDTATGLRVLGGASSTRATWLQRCAGPGDDLTDWLDRVGFPQQGLVISPEGADGPVVKGVTSPDGLALALARAATQSSTGRAQISTDLRAMHNPDRQLVITAAAADLADRLARACPGCGSPGYGPDYVETGLPCRTCGTPTTEKAATISTCPAGCGHTSRALVEATAADPGRCPYCNP